MRPAIIKALFAGTIFTSAFLLFLVQPLIAKQILPWFGGSAAVWSICMVFFQVVLLAGYAYSDWVTRRLGAWAQAKLHVGLLLASLAFLPIVTSARWKPTGSEDPTLWILGLLLGTIGLPYFLLSTTGPLVQSWVARTPWGAQVYRYFSLSNFASLASLLSYPVLIEPRSTLVQQAWGWSLAYGVFVLLCAATTLYVARHWAAPARGAGELPSGTVTKAARPGLGDHLMWLALPALGSWLLLAITNHITQNVAAIPFLWVLPLSVYLLSFVLTFESDRWYRRAVFVPLAAVMLALCAFGLQDSLGSDLRTALPIYVVGLFALCMFLHGEMSRLRPGSAYLTRFYLMLSLGGALGGVSVGLIAPHVLPAYYELGVGLTLCALIGAVLWRQRRVGMAASLALAGASAWFLFLQVNVDATGVRRMQRNFYGTLVTLDTQRGSARDDVRQMYHGSVKHGEQYLAPERRREPTTYYGPRSGVGLAISAAPASSRQVGLIGLGAGTLATYGRAGDVYRVYEINPEVFDLADTEFSFLADSRARIERVLGDARLALEREPAQAFDVLAVDAFSGDSVPIHLITSEAMDVYLRHMRPEGIVAFHVTNRFLALAPVVEKIAQAKGLHVALVHDEPAEPGLRNTDWVLVARDQAVLTRDAIRIASSTIDPIPGLEPWTDDNNNLFSVLK
ncbi:fused MFS/spermidine synthase [Variovorax sp. J2P1-59]|uniref:fused MFS/spermidine synthase n=1 Tax=Variovorax flavidus TaxID=3053501 RepID=UPI0025785A5A|nr:fused MFS/spermidine synthase [Variovorax sp. J2P1-59]MDM0074912.1 fused MFS/spermidine synthase [Variovorax sp. J2P1-59]